MAGLSLRGGGVDTGLVAGDLSPSLDGSVMTRGDVGVSLILFNGSGVRLLTLAGGVGFGPFGLIL